MADASLVKLPSDECYRCNMSTSLLTTRSAGCPHGWVSYHDDVIKWKHFPRDWPFVRGIHRSPVNSPHKGQYRGALKFSLICARINGWVNNRDAGDLRRHRTHYDVIVMRCWLSEEQVGRSCVRNPVGLLVPPGALHWRLVLFAVNDCKKACMYDCLNGLIL